MKTKTEIISNMDKSKATPPASDMRKEATDYDQRASGEKKKDHFLLVHYPYSGDELRTKSKGLPPPKLQSTQERSPEMRAQTTPSS